MIEAKAYSFQDNKKANIAAAPMPGPDTGAVRRESVERAKALCYGARRTRRRTLKNNEG